MPGTITYKFGTFVSKFISALFHPLLVPTYTYLLIVSQINFITLQIPYELKWTLAALIFVTTFGIPAMLFMLMLRMKMISSLAMPLRNDRPIPIIITSVFFYFTYYVLKYLGVAPLFYYYMLGASLLAVICFTINYIYKISLHMAALGAAVGSFIGLSLLLQTPLLTTVIVIILIAGITGTARLNLGAHNGAEVYSGFITGLLFMLMLFYILL
jgi:hypothetical protein